MKKLFIVIAFLIPFIMKAQSRSETQVAEAVEKLKKAMLNGDLVKLNDITADNLSYGHSSGLVENKNDFIEKLVNGESHFLSIDLTEQTISISDNTAIVRHILTAKTHDKGKDIADVHLKVLLVWQKQKGGWRLLARQAVKIP
jgi:ketosteroid isomerase-like protein